MNCSTPYFATAGMIVVRAVDANLDVYQCNGQACLNTSSNYNDHHEKIAYDTEVLKNLGERQ